MKSSILLIVCLLSTNIKTFAQIIDSLETNPDSILYAYADKMPLFVADSCDTVLLYKERRNCAEKAMLNFIYRNLRYPINSCLEGFVIVRFVVEKDGSITNIEILKDIGGRAGEEALKVVKLLPKFEPGWHNGKLVRVRYNLPVRFYLGE